MGIMLSFKAETKDGRKYNDQEQSEDMIRINRRFSTNHSMVIHLNAISIIATILYAFLLAASLQP